MAGVLHAPSTSQRGVFLAGSCMKFCQVYVSVSRTVSPELFGGFFEVHFDSTQQPSAGDDLSSSLPRAGLNGKLAFLAPALSPALSR